MAGKRGPDATDRDWMEAAYDWAGEVGESTGKAVQVSMYPSGRRGVWRVQVRLLETVDGRPAAVALQVTGEWPNVSRAGFCAYVHALTMQLDNLAVCDPLRSEAAA